MAVSFKDLQDILADLSRGNMCAADVRARESEIQRLIAQQPNGVIFSGCCPSLTIVNFGLPTQHVVYCEGDIVPRVDTHEGPHHGLAGVDVPGFGAPTEWQWP